MSVYFAGKHSPPVGLVTKNVIRLPSIGQFCQEMFWSLLQFCSVPKINKILHLFSLTLLRKGNLSRIRTHLNFAIITVSLQNSDPPQFCHYNCIREDRLFFHPQSDSLTRAETPWRAPGAPWTAFRRDKLYIKWLSVRPLVGVLTLSKISKGVFQHTGKEYRKEDWGEIEDVPVWRL